MVENKIVIVEDVGSLIKFEDVTIKHDEIDRDKVVAIEEQIADLEAQKIALDEQLIALKVEIEYAKKVIAIADAEKLKAEEEARAKALAEEGSISVETEGTMGV